MSRPWACLAGLVLLLAMSRTGMAQELFVTGGPDGSTSHAWMIIPGAGDGTILHFYPRRKGEALDAGAPARRAGVIDGLPQFAAAGGDRLFIVCRGTQGERRIWRVFSMRAVAAPIGEAWVTEPMDGFDIHPPLDSPTRPLDFSVSAAGACALTIEGESLSLRLLRGGRWMPLELPEGFDIATPSQRDGMRLLGTRDGLLLLRIDSEARTIHAWSCRWSTQALSRLDTERTREGLAPLAWEPRNAAWETPPLDTLHAEIRVCVVDERVVMAARDGEGTLWLHVSPLPGELAFAPLDSLEGVDAAFGVAGADGRLLVAQFEETHQGRGVRIRELDLAGAGVVYDGPARLGAPLGRPEYLLLAAIMLQLTACALVFILKPEQRDAIWLPDDYALAPGFRRMLGGALDLSLVLGITERFWLTFAPAILGENDTPVMRALALAVSTMALLVLQGTLLEAAFGRTLGKFVASIRVIAPRPVPGETAPVAARPSMGQSFLRNLVKWGLPPLGLLSLLDREGRNRGDQMAGTLTAMRLEPEPLTRDDDADDR